MRAEGIVELSLATGEERVLIPQQPDSFLQDPAVSPDGTRLAYSIGLAPPVIPGQDIDFGSDLYVSGIDGADPALLLQHGAPNEHVRWPSWYPDGQLLISMQRLVGGSFALALERFNVAAGSRTMLLPGALRPSLSVDGRMIAYVTQDDNLAEALWIANADGNGARLLATSGEGFSSFEVPRFSPDGKTVAFGASTLPAVRAPPGAGERYVFHAASASARNGEQMDLWLIDADGANVRMLADMNVDAPSLAWSADGERIFVLDVGGLYAVLPADGSVYRLGEGTFHGQLAWLAAE